MGATPTKIRKEGGIGKDAPRSVEFLMFNRTSVKSVQLGKTLTLNIIWSLCFLLSLESFFQFFVDGYVFSKIWSHKSIRGGGSLGMRRVSIPKANIFNLSILKSLELSKKFAVVENDFSVFALT